MLGCGVSRATYVCVGRYEATQPSKNIQRAHPFILSIQQHERVASADWHKLSSEIQHVKLLEVTLVYKKCPNVMFWLVSIPCPERRDRV